MKLSEFKNHLLNLKSLHFIKQNGVDIPAHFHITEVGLSVKYFIDCGIEVHNQKFANLQIWVSNDHDHRLEPKALLDIIDYSRKVLGDEDPEIEIEYQGETIGKYGLDISGEQFILVAKHTDCLAKTKCDIPQPKQKRSLASLAGNTTSCCSPGSGCC